MSLQISEDYNRAYNLLQRMGMIAPDQDDVHTGIKGCDTIAQIEICRGRYRLFLECGDDQYVDNFTVRVRSIDEGVDILAINSPEIDLHSESVNEPWSISLNLQGEGHLSLREFIFRNWRELEDVEDPSSLVPIEHQLNPQSEFMFAFIQKVFAWFRLLPV